MEGPTRKSARTAGTVAGIIIIIIGIIFLLDALNLFWWFRWIFVWPVILIIAGLLIIFALRRK